MVKTQLKGRQTSILRDLSRSVEGIPLVTLMARYGVSRRTVYYDVTGIDRWLSERGNGHVCIESQVVTAENVQWDKLSKGSPNRSHPYYSVEERQAMALLYIALSTEPVTINWLMGAFEVSRNTVIADIRALKSEAKQRGLEIVSTSNSGYSIEGEEISLRQFVWAELQRLNDADCVDALHRFLQTTLTMATNNDIDYSELCRSLIKQYETDLQTRCFLESDGLEGVMIQVSWLRGLSGHWVTMGREEQLTLMGTVSYRSVQNSVEKLKNTGIILPSEEMLYITSLLLGIKTTSFAMQREEDQYVSDLAESLIEDFERVACLTFVNKSIVREQLTHHIRPLYYRQKYGILVHNPLATDVQKMYPMTYDFTRRAAIMAGMPSLSADELGYLTIYLSADLDNKMLEEGDTSASKVLMVGAANMSTATLVREQLVDACGIQFEFDYTEPGKLHRWDLDGYALVLALTPLPSEMHSDNMVEVTPFLSDASKQQIYHILRNNRIISRYNGLIEGIVSIIEGALPEADHELLRTDRIHFELFRFFDERDRGLSDDPIAQPQDAHIEGDYVTIPEGSTWQQATLAGAEALQGGVDTSRFVERMKNIVSGPHFLYYRMGDSPDVVIVRCPMQGDDNAHVAAQIVVSPDGVEFPDGMRAKVIVCIATINRYSHWGTLFSVYQYLSDQEHVRQIEAECHTSGGDIGISGGRS